MSPADKLRARAEALESEGRALQERGKYEEAATRLVLALDIRAAADEVEGLQSMESTDSLQGVTQAQLERRARGIAVALAEGDDKKTAIVKRWGTLGKAAKALRISPQSLSAYLHGVSPCPENVARIVERETKLPADSRTWPKGTTK